MRIIGKPLRLFMLYIFNGRFLSTFIRLKWYFWKDRCFCKDLSSVAGKRKLHFFTEDTFWTRFPVKRWAWRHGYHSKCKNPERTGIGSSCVSHSRLEKCNIYFGGWPSESVFLCVENSSPTHSMAGMVRQLLDIEFVQDGVFHPYCSENSTWSRH